MEIAYFKLRGKDRDYRIVFGLLEQFYVDCDKIKNYIWSQFDTDGFLDDEMAFAALLDSGKFEK